MIKLINLERKSKFKLLLFIPLSITLALVHGSIDKWTVSLNFILFYLALIYFWSIGVQQKIISIFIITLVTLNLSASFNALHYYSSGFNVISAHSLLNTRLSESSEFISSHFDSALFILLLITVSIIFLTSINKIISPLHFRKYFWLFILFNSILFIFGSFTTRSDLAGVRKHNLIINFIQKTVLYNFHPLMVAWNEKNLISILSQNKDYSYFAANRTPTAHNVSAIVVIGESARRDRHGLFGYSQETTPNMSKRKKELLVFNKANSSSSQTILSVPSSLSSISIEGISAHNLQKNIITLLNQAGYQTEWLSMQGLGLGKHESYITAIAKMSTYHKAIAAQYDTQVLKHVHPEKNKVTFIHLNGSHFNFHSRYPANFSLPYLKQNVGEDKSLYNYDTSIAYTDELLEKLIQKLMGKNSVLFYFSDHGLENRFGKFKHGLSSPSQEAYEVPFFIWQSKQFKQHALLSKNNVNKTFNTQDLFFTIADTLGITNYDGEQVCKSIIQDCYQEPTRNTVVDETLSYYEFKSLKREH